MLLFGLRKCFIERTGDGQEARTTRSAGATTNLPGCILFTPNYDLLPLLLNQLESDGETVWAMMQHLVGSECVDQLGEEHAKEVQQCLMISFSNEWISTDELLCARCGMKVTRYGGCLLHSISAVLGGVASQEAVKILTHQYIPINNTYVYNGIAGCGAMYKL